MTRIGIIGKGAWGGALGSTLLNAGNEVSFWTRGDDAKVLSGADIVIAAVPAQSTRSVLQHLQPALPPGVPLVLTAKGLERHSMLRQSQIVAEVAPNHPIAVLSGPSFATDLTRGLPTAVTLASESMDEDLQQRLSTQSLRLYLSEDVVGVELGGTLKNVVAIACGAAIGAGLGESARAALMARGFAELVRIGLAMEAKAETISGLSGLGDLTLTATSSQSRNFRFGLALGQTGTALSNGTYEGAATAGAAHALAKRMHINAPIIETVAALADNKLTVQEAINRLMNRPLRRE